MINIPFNPKFNSLFWTVKTRLIYTYGREPNIIDLKNLVDIIHNQHSIPTDRNVKRSKESIIFWISQHWDIAQYHLRQISNEYPYNPKNVIFKSQCSNEKKIKLMKDYLLRDKMIQVEFFLSQKFQKKKLKMSELKSIAESICQITNLKLSRNEKRDKCSNLAWFAYNWDVIRTVIPNIISTIKFKEEKKESFKKDINDNNNNKLYQVNNIFGYDYTDESFEDLFDCQSI